MLSQAIGALLAPAVAVALSPIPIVAVVLVLGTPRARRTGTAFAAGWILGLTAVSVVVVLLASGSDDPGSTAASGVNWLELAIGLTFLVMAGRQWRKRPRHGEEPELPAWMAKVDDLDARRALVLGIALSGANPKNLALTLAASASIAQAGLDGTDTAIAVAIFVAIGSLTVAGAVAAYLIDHERADRPLTSIKQFMAAHNAVIMMVILLLIGANLVGEGLAGLWT